MNNQYDMYVSKTETKLTHKLRSVLYGKETISSNV